MIPTLLLTAIVAQIGGETQVLRQGNGLAYQSLGSTVSTVGDANNDVHDDDMANFHDSSSGSNIGVVRVISGKTNDLLYELRGFTPNDSFGYGLGPAGGFIDSGADDSLLHRQNDTYDLGFFGYELLGRGIAAEGDVKGDGVALVTGDDPYLVASSLEISASQATQIRLAIDFPLTASMQEYRVLFSTTGSGPELFNIEIPLSLDSTLRDSYAGIYPFPQHNNLQGFLNLHGRARASFTTPASLPSGLIGRSLWMAAISISIWNPGEPTHTSSVVRFVIVP
ncbi:MAG: hypothetical protein COA70_08875 [Planctomycetota bacterium]|nr:MAG: hypothetical protein COA70_08875 [Planctomycetota bacterium]